MNNILYNKKLLNKYDPSFSLDYLFINELDENQNYELIKHSRKVLSIHNLTRYIYLSTLNINISEYGYLLSAASTLINLSKVGDNVFMLTYLEYKDIFAVYSTLHTFIAKYNCYIDISKHAYLFEDFQEVYLHKLQK